MPVKALPSDMTFCGAEYEKTMEPASPMTMPTEENPDSETSYLLPPVNSTAYGNFYSAINSPEISPID